VHDLLERGLRAPERLRYQPRLGDTIDIDPDEPSLAIRSYLRLRQDAMSRCRTEVPIPVHVGLERIMNALFLKDLADMLCLRDQRGKPTRRSRSPKRGSERNGSNPGLTYKFCS
jgi:hypothetical protein